ncbi:hypothetical protein BpHYR1_033956 [Brachionus plicatilis]|uniref:Uncharacterized protein n=1 Tax=Brachionus plicatilis TaxID=10195 RepID=A0A3M7QB66_BRAPC|nr:hypothetical protein BpHYR1_033956 [Brachionus plicatilis]
MIQKIFCHLEQELKKRPKKIGKVFVVGMEFKQNKYLDEEYQNKFINLRVLDDRQTVLDDIVKFQNKNNRYVSKIFYLFSIMFC